MLTILAHFTVTEVPSSLLLIVAGFGLGVLATLALRYVRTR